MRKECMLTISFYRLAGRAREKAVCDDPSPLCLKLSIAAAA